MRELGPCEQGCKGNIFFVAQLDSLFSVVWDHQQKISNSKKSAHRTPGVFRYFWSMDSCFSPA